MISPHVTAVIPVVRVPSYRFKSLKWWNILEWWIVLLCVLAALIILSGVVAILHKVSLINSIPASSLLRGFPCDVSSHAMNSIVCLANTGKATDNVGHANRRM